MSDYSTTEKVSAYIGILRWVDDVVMGLGLIVALTLAGSIQENIPLLTYILVFIGGFLVSAHAMVINDIIDIDIDKINEPDRAIPSGKISTNQAMIYGIMLAVLGIGCFALLDIQGAFAIPYSSVFVFGHVILADLYNLYFKKTGFFGNIIVAYNAFALFLFGDIFINGRLTLLPTAVGFMAFFANLGREIFKGIIDQEGDREHNISTLAIIAGPIFAKYTSISFLVICIGLALFILPNMALIGQIGIVLFLILFVYILYLSKDAEQPKRSRKIKTFILIGPLMLSPFLILDQIYSIKVF